MLGRVSYIRKDRQLSEKVFRESERIVSEHTEHAGYSCEVRYLFSFRGMDLRKNQAIEQAVRDWAATVTASAVASKDAGHILFLRAKGWDDHFAGKTTLYGLSLIVSCPGVSISASEGLHKVFCDMYDDNLYVGFDIQLPQGIKGYPFTMEFTC